MVPEKPVEQSCQSLPSIAEAMRSGEHTLISLGIVVLEADLELDGLQEVTLLGLIAVLEEISDVLTHTGYSRGSVSDSKMSRWQ